MQTLLRQSSTHIISLYSSKTCNGQRQVLQFRIWCLYPNLSSPIKLSEELRIKIWKHAMATPRWVHFSVDRFSTDDDKKGIKHCRMVAEDDAVRKTFILTYHESRLACNEVHQQILSVADTQPLADKTNMESTLRGGINIEQDLLMRSLGDLTELWEYDSWRNSVTKLKHLAITGCDDPENLQIYIDERCQSFWDLWNALPALKRLSFIQGRGSCL